jgi:hypothetical protein
VLPRLSARELASGLIKAGGNSRQPRLFHFF